MPGFAPGGVRRVGTQTFTVGAGGDFATLQAAITFVNSQFLQPGYYTTLSLLDGTLTATSPITLESSFGKQIVIQGQNSYAKTVSSVQSSSGSAGAYAIILNVNSVANVSVGDYFAVTTGTGGTNPTYLLGCHEITNVDAVNTRITITSKHRASSAPAGAVVASGTILKAVLKFTGCDGLRIWNGATGINLDKLVIAGDGTASTSGVQTDDVGRCYVQTILGVVGFGAYGLTSIQNAQMNTDGILLVSGNNVGVQAYLGGSINATIIASGNGQDGVFAEVGGVIRAPAASVSTGNGNNGWHGTSGANIQCPLTTATGNQGGGYLSETQAFVNDAGTTTSGNVGASSAVPCETPRKFQIASSTQWDAPANGVMRIRKANGSICTVAELGTANAGNRAMVSDSTVAASGNFGAIVAGGGTFTVPVFGDGTNNRIG